MLPDYTNELLKCQIDPTYFFTKYLHITLTDIQSAWLQEIQNAKQEDIVGPIYLDDDTRQIGRTTLMCSYAIWLMVTKDFQRTIFYVPTAPMARHTRNMFKSMMQLLPSWMMIDRRNAVAKNKKITIPNEISIGPDNFILVTAEYKRGAPVDTIFVDNKQLFPYDVPYKPDPLQQFIYCN